MTRLAVSLRVSAEIRVRFVTARQVREVIVGRTPGRECVQTARNKSTLGHTKEEPGRDERAIPVLERLEEGDEAEEEQLQREPLARPHAVQDHVAGNFEQHDAEREHLLTDVELVLVDADVLQLRSREVGQCLEYHGREAKEERFE